MTRNQFSVIGVLLGNLVLACVPVRGASEFQARVNAGVLIDDNITLQPIDESLATDDLEHESSRMTLGLDLEYLRAGFLGRYALTRHHHLVNPELRFTHQVLDLSYERSGNLESLYRILARVERVQPSAILPANDLTGIVTFTTSELPDQESVGLLVDQGLNADDHVELEGYYVQRRYPSNFVLDSHVRGSRAQFSRLVDPDTQLLLEVAESRTVYPNITNDSNLSLEILEASLGGGVSWALNDELGFLVKTGVSKLDSAQTDFVTDQVNLSMVGEYANKKNRVVSVLFQLSRRDYPERFVFLGGPNQQDSEILMNLYGSIPLDERFTGIFNASYDRNDSNNPDTNYVRRTWTFEVSFDL